MIIRKAPSTTTAILATSLGGYWREPCGAVSFGTCCGRDTDPCRRERVRISACRVFRCRFRCPAVAQTTPGAEVGVTRRAGADGRPLHPDPAPTVMISRRGDLSSTGHGCAV